MPGPLNFNWTVSAGNLIQIFIFTVSLIGAWFVIDFRSQTNQQSVVRVEKDVSRIDSQIRELQEDAVRSDERYNNLLILLARIETQLERLVNQQ